MLEYESDAQTENTMASAFAELDPIALGTGLAVVLVLGTVMWLATATLLLARAGRTWGCICAAWGYYLPGLRRDLVRLR